MTLVGALVLSGCGGGGGGGSSTATVSSNNTVASSADAVRFLNQATYGATDAAITSVTALGYSGWIAQQMSLPASPSAKDHIDAIMTPLRAANPNAFVNPAYFEQAYWTSAAQGSDQLRLRIQLALSEIFVVSMNGTAINPYWMGGYWDMLGRDAFGNFRTLLEDVTLHPAMGQYLSSLGNSKEDPKTGKVPDENFAREIMQLMTIGLYQLNADGTRKLDSTGAPVLSYSHDDIVGLARALTGFGYYNANGPYSATNPTGGRYWDAKGDPTYSHPMMLFPDRHSISAKSFLGVTIPATTVPDASGDLKIALDTLYNHPNVGPFIGRQLIQRLVTSNPSAAYVSRVAAVFANNGQGVRGDMAAVIKAVLMDPEARDLSTANLASYGKVREPLVRFANLLHTFGSTSASGTWNIGFTNDPTSLNQQALYSPTVFNFFRPGFVPPNSRTGTANREAPELQLVNEVSVSGYVNALYQTLNGGVGTPPAGQAGRDVNLTLTDEATLATDPTKLVAKLNLLLCANQMSSALQQKVITAVTSIVVPGGTATQAQIDAALLQRVRLGILLVMSSGDYLVQR